MLFVLWVWLVYWCVENRFSWMLFGLLEELIKLCAGLLNTLLLNFGGIVGLPCVFRSTHDIIKLRVFDPSIVKVTVIQLLFWCPSGWFHPLVSLSNRRTRLISSWLPIFNNRLVKRSLFLLLFLYHWGYYLLWLVRLFVWILLHGLFAV